MLPHPPLCIYEGNVCCTKSLEVTFGSVPHKCSDTRISQKVNVHVSRGQSKEILIYGNILYRKLDVS